MIDSTTLRDEVVQDQNQGSTKDACEEVESISKGWYYVGGDQRQHEYKIQFQYHSGKAYCVWTEENLIAYMVLEAADGQTWLQGQVLKNGQQQPIADIRIQLQARQFLHSWWGDGRTWQNALKAYPIPAKSSAFRPPSYSNVMGTQQHQQRPSAPHLPSHQSEFAAKPFVTAEKFNDANLCGDWYYNDGKNHYKIINTGSQYVYEEGAVKARLTKVDNYLKADLKQADAKGHQQIVGRIQFQPWFGESLKADVTMGANFFTTVASRTRPSAPSLQAQIPSVTNSARQNIPKYPQQTFTSRTSQNVPIYPHGVQPSRSSRGGTGGHNYPVSTVDVVNVGDLAVGLAGFLSNLALLGVVFG